MPSWNVSGIAGVLLTLWLFWPYICLAVGGVGLSIAVFYGSTIFMITFSVLLVLGVYGFISRDSGGT